MENIFTYNPTKEELAEFAYQDTDESGYISDLSKRADAAGSSADYERVADLQHLFKMRGIMDQVKRYTKILDENFPEIRSRLFNE